MTIEVSTGVRQGMLNASGLLELFTNGVLELRSGPQPVNADAAAQGNLLCLITLSGGAFTPGASTNGINFDAPSGGVLAKAAAEVWSGNASAAGTLGHFRLKGNATDAGGASTTLPRIDGSIALSGGDLNLANIVMAIGTPVQITAFQFTMPDAA